MSSSVLEQHPESAPVELTTFFDVSLDILIIRDLDGRVVKASRSWQAMLGWLPEEIEGGGLLRFIHPDDVPGTLGSIVEVETRRTGDPVLGHINRYRHKDGHYRLLEWRAQRFGDRIYAVARDVTERAAAEQALIAAKTAAEDASRAKTDFLANMSHEIRTPLNGVIGLTAALARTPLNEEQREIVALIERSGVTLERLVSDVLDVSKIEAGRLDIELRTIDLGAELDSILGVMRVKAEDKGLTFKVERGLTARGDVMADGVRIRQVMANLLSNAIKFTERGGVRVIIGLDDETDMAGVSHLRVEVHDTGVGFDAEFAGRAFGRFNQADTSITRRFGGTGLGLSICKALVEMMGGEIEARSEPRRGSVFAFTVPVSRTRSLATFDLSRTEPAVPVVGGHSHDANPLAPGLRILLAEDHPVNQRVVQLILGGVGATVVVAENGEEAVAAFHKGAFDVVLMDMQMPVMDGLTATRAIRALEVGRSDGRRTPLIMLSANAMSQHRSDAADAGADLHLPKPITAESLLGAIETALGGLSRLG